MNNILDKIFKNSKKIEINDSDKFVIFSDCHRGIGDIKDNFIKNKSLFVQSAIFDIPLLYLFYIRAFFPLLWYNYTIGGEAPMVARWL